MCICCVGRLAQVHFAVRYIPSSFGRVMFGHGVVNSSFAEAEMAPSGLAEAPRATSFAEAEMVPIGLYESHRAIILSLVEPRADCTGCLSLWCKICIEARGKAWADLADTQVSALRLRSDVSVGTSGCPSLQSVDTDALESACVGEATCSDTSESPSSADDGWHGLFARSGLAPTVVTEAIGWANKCLQTSVVRLLPEDERDLALTYFNDVCSSNAKCGKAGGADERVNFNRVLWFLMG